MNTHLTLFGLFAGMSAMVASAQPESQLDRQLATSSICMSLPGHDTPLNGEERGGGSVVWSEDFANGLAGNNPSGPWTTDGPNGDIWRVNSNGPRGAYTLATERISSSTWSNGFAKFASDSANSNWSSGTPVALPNFTDWEGSLVSPVIDLSATPYVQLVFSQRSRWCCGDSPFKLEISSDGGQSWATSFLTNEGLPINQGAPGTNTTSATTETRRFNIASAIAEDPSNVRFRFRHDSEAGTSHYYWQIDDISIENLPDYELQMNYAYVSSTGAGEEYGRMPVAQLPSVMNIGAEVYNYGGSVQSNVSVQCVITTQAGTEVLSHTTPLGDLISGASAISDDNINLPFLEIGRYNSTFSVNSDFIDQDGVPADNSKVRNFEVTLNEYSLDALGNYPAGQEVRQQLGTASFTDNATMNLMTMYKILTGGYAYSATIILGTNTRAGEAATVEVFLLDTADVLNIASSTVDLPIDGVTSDVVSITQQHVSAGRITVPLIQPVWLSPGAYYLCARISGSGTSATNDPEVYIADDNTVPQPGISTMIWLPVDFNSDGTEGRHVYGNGNAAAIRLNITPAVGIEEDLAGKGVSMYPNPTNGMLNIVSDATGLMNVEVIDLLGAVVRATKFTGRTTMDLTGLAHGVYSVRVSNGDQSKVERITLH